MTKDRRYVLFSVAITLVYSALNAGFVFFSYLPGLTTFVFWGILAPISAAIFFWFYLRRHIARPRSWIIASSMLSAFYMIAGIATIYSVGTLWASV